MRITLLEVEVHLAYTEGFKGASKTASIWFKTTEETPTLIYPKVYQKVTSMFGEKVYVIMRRIQLDRKWSDVEKKGIWI
jgi:hypothetical protein